MKFVDSPHKLKFCRLKFIGKLITQHKSCVGMSPKLYRNDIAYTGTTYYSNSLFVTRNVKAEAASSMLYIRWRYVLALESRYDVLGNLL